MRKSSLASLGESTRTVFGSFSFKSIIDFFRTNPSFIDLSNCDLQHCSLEQWGDLAEQLQSCGELREIVVSSNALFTSTRDRYKAACNAFSHAKNILQFDLSNNITPVQNVHRWSTIESMLKSMDNLRILGFRSNNLGNINALIPDKNRVMVVMIKALSVNHSLHTLDLRFNYLNRLSADVLKKLFDALLENENLLNVKIADDEFEPNSNKVLEFSEEQKYYYDQFQDELQKRQEIDEQSEEDSVEDFETSLQELQIDERITFEQLNIQLQEVARELDKLIVVRKNLEKLKDENLENMETKQISRIFKGILRNTPTVLMFYKMVNIKLEEIFIGVKAAASGVVSHQIEGNFATAEKVVNIVGMIVNNLPFIGNMLNNVSKIAQEQLKVIDHERSMGLIKHLSTIGTLDEVKLISETIARYLTIMYFEQLCELKTAAEVKRDLSSSLPTGTLLGNLAQKVSEYGKRTYKYVSGVRSNEIAYILSEIAVMKILNAFLSEKIDINEPVVPQVLRIISSDVSKLHKIKSGVEKLASNPLACILKTLFDEKTIVTHSGKTWMVEKIFVKPGYRTSAGCYTSQELDTATYGFRWCFEELDGRHDLRSIPSPDYLSQGVIAQFHRNISDHGLLNDSYRNLFRN